MEDNEINKMMYQKSIISGKVHYSLEDPLSQLFYDMSDLISPYLYNLGITPNMITFQRFALIIFVFTYMFCNKMYKSAALVYIYAYFCDCLDGHMSRKYEMETQFGDYFDHMADILTVLISLYLIAKTINKKYYWVLFIVLIVLLISLIQISCQERYLEIAGMNIDSKSLKIIKCLCPQSVIPNQNIEKTMEITKFFGAGTYQLFITLLIWNFNYLV